MKPALIIDLKKLKENVEVEVELLKKEGVEVMGVNKVFDGCIQSAKALLDGGIKVIAESRLYNLKNIKNELGCITCLLRSPLLSEIDETVRYADISLNSELKILKELNAAALKQNKIHQVLLMIDMGDLREGIWFEKEDEIKKAMMYIKKASNLELFGLGTNYNCYGTVLPSVKNSKDFIKLAEKMSKIVDIKIPRLSAGNCTSYHLIDKALWDKKLNHLRIGGLHQFGIEYVDMKYVNNFHHSSKDVNRACSPLYVLRAEIIEINTKPTVPVGELGVDAFLKVKHFEDRGIKRRALLAFGRQDIPSENITPVDDNYVILGQTSDHTILEIPDNSLLKLGDFVYFELDYTALLMACQTKGIDKIFLY
ncbi:alanine/ornithine racemase family PLP-dependent enzyme [Campylobacter canadensis]|uniref:Alanine/ornithine racemase family PLP-dependent enzyme n=1 Tax=Campylobacter canadensis TaxID=449520 RepID=A0ABS7WSR0_9BACT|nr:alanine/ornithine racemase family PLP-dependent enzyme [Campylobacter canadensis]MBZ7987810.1 alanine/ornithine racemase family PLP-dependent enzyme [Campylobacter canadensis]MBZ7995326.1 alanine/ornithine racemase family PLP-dependent enzyme [Campylobacter canadensis]MBZ7997026.1 alanine/ornithine racemase family PLP-dependent enzyme [Campylobacter canadensis]MBZ7998931.1 alanine/ornithine racemase family PLP-dependent enzyme [Campylobacter canadensis]MBZ8000656.1 alanine/ornithine racemas